LVVAVSVSEDELWRRASDVVGLSCGWSLRRVRLLGGQPRDLRRTWLVQGEPGLVVMKASPNPFATAHAAWAPKALAALAARAYPAPKVLWHGVLAEGWSLVLFERLPGQPLETLDDSTLEALVALVELQSDLTIGPGGWDTAEWIELVLFEGWEGWRDAAESAAPKTSKRLHAFLEPARGYRLPTGDLVHGDLNLSNVLAMDGTITGVVDWDALGYGSRASDLAGPLFDWHRLRLTGKRVATAGDVRIVSRIVELSGDEGLRCSIGYAALGRLAVTAKRGQHGDLAMWRRVTDEILDSLA
jgi:aminoglycoside phosphotransferase (APT) family kinase protein